MRTQFKLVLVTAILAAVVGCQTDPVGLKEDGADLAAKMNTTTPLAHHALLQSLDYEVITGTISPRWGGLLTGAAKTWPEDSNFGLLVPPGALNTTDSLPVEFTLRVPTFDSYMAFAERGLPLVFRLEPHGMQFLEPVTVLGTYMPRDERMPTHFWHVTPVYEDGEVVDVRYEEFGEVDVHPGRAGLQVMFQVNHFSDWEVGQLRD
ncbi:hypothetical protein KKG45_08840 [bacterium]|nr:hypothetical protein [bacterium]MBU1073340.1 hypothetical protein [bacterium]MBU1676455.1 hypothetical protein [bacterium]